MRTSRLVDMAALVWGDRKKPLPPRAVRRATFHAAPKATRGPWERRTVYKPLLAKPEEWVAFREAIGWFVHLSPNRAG